jgi:CheY-like chemotaxis protein
MNKIAIVDDQDSARLAVQSVIEDVLSNEDLEAEWGVVSTAPLADVEAYANFIDSENVAILLIDERLGESPDASGITVNYKGSELVEQLRKNYKQMPIYGITAFPQDESLETHFAQFDEIILRDTFTQKAASYVPRFIRAYQNFLKVRDDTLAELGTISAKIASGTATDDEKRRAAEIQEKLNLPGTVQDISSRSEWLTEYATLLKKQEEINNLARKHLGESDQEDKK